MNREEYLKSVVDDIEKKLDDMINGLESLSSKKHEEALEEILDEISSLIGKTKDLDDEVTYSTLVTISNDFKFIRDQPQAIIGIFNDIKQSLSELIEYSTDNTFSSLNLFSKKDLIPVQNERIIQEILDEPMSGLTLDEMFERDRNSLIYRTKRTLVTGVKNGETYEQIKKKVSKIYDNNDNKAKSIVNTELHRGAEKAKTKTIEHANEQIPLVKTWNSADDELVRAAHNDLDDTTIDADKDFISEAGGKGPGPGEMNNASDDIYCRCFKTFDFKNSDDAYQNTDNIPGYDDSN